MTEIERITATAESYQRVADLLNLEQLILATMGLKEPETRTHVITQAARVHAIERVKEALAAGLVPAQALSA